MDFDKLMEYLSSLTEKAKPVGGLISDFYFSLTSNIPDFDMIFSVIKWVGIIVVVLILFYRAATD